MKRITLCILLLLPFLNLSAQQKKVMTMDIKSEIDVRSNRYVELALKHADKIKADYIIIEMNTYGGTLTDAKDIGDKLLAFKTPVWVFVNPNAASAGALISISCDSIYMSPAASMGAATVVGANGEKAIDKYQSYMRSYMRAAATANKRNPQIAEGMVEESIKIDSIKEVGKIITLSTSEAIKYGYCEGQVESIDDILKKNKIENAEVLHFELGIADKVIDFIMNPFISGILILAILGGFYFELQTPGVGFPGAAALAALVIYLVPYYLNGLADNWEIIAFFIGIILLALEIFVIPGFGVAGITGITLMLSSLILMMLNNDFFDFEFVKVDDIMFATLTAFTALLGGIALVFLGSSKITNSKAFKRLALTDTQQHDKGYTANFNKEPMIGKTGVTFTILKPSGKVMIDNLIYDAFTKAGYVEEGKSIEVIGEEGSTLRVKPID
jgi:membrane-bound serine protease (ClpP class)